MRLEGGEECKWSGAVAQLEAVRSIYIAWWCTGHVREDKECPLKRRKDGMRMCYKAYTQRASAKVGACDAKFNGL